jgi:lysophospholipid acyltransferase (LPLAT)-like uncharacterized protein
MAQPLEPVRRPRQRRPFSRGLRQLGERTWLTGVVATLAAWYFRLVKATCRVSFEPASPFLHYADQLPVIGAIWHGTQFLLPVIDRSDRPVRILVSNHRDGELMAAVARKLGAETVRGSGGRAAARWVEKGGVTGFLGLRASITAGHTVLMALDNAAAPRRVGTGVIALARVTGRPIVAVGIAATPRLTIRSWDRTTLPLPFSRIVCVVSPVVTVPAAADDATIEARRREVEDALNAANDRALAVADGGVV